MVTFVLDDPYHFSMAIPVPEALATQMRREVSLEFARDGGAVTAQERSKVERFLADIVYCIAWLGPRREANAC